MQISNTSSIGDSGTTSIQYQKGPSRSTLSFHFVFFRTTSSPNGIVILSQQTHAYRKGNDQTQSSLVGQNVLNFFYQLSKEEIEVLSLGLGFCPDLRLDNFDTIKDVHLFVRKLNLKALYHKHKAPNTRMEVLQSLSKSECRALKELLEM